MSKLCLGTFLTVIKKCSVKTGFVQRTDFQNMFEMIDYSYEPDESLIGHLVRGAKNPSQSVIDTINNLEPDEYSKLCGCMDGIANRIDPNKVVLLGKMYKKIVDGDESIEDDTIVDLVNGTMKKDLPGNYGNLSSFLTGIFIYVIKYTDNKGMTEYVKELDDEFIAGIIAENNLSRKNYKECRTNLLHLDKDDLISREFLIKHENERELIPLCPLAYAFNPNHQHIRSMYTEYNLLTHNSQKSILEQIDVGYLMEVDNVAGKCPDVFQVCLRDFELSSDRYLYLFGQYFHKAFKNYPDCDVSKFNINSFVRLYRSTVLSYTNNQDYCSLDQHISDYLWLREKGIGKDELIPPMDYLWDKEHLESCAEDQLTFWLCRFIIDSCQNIVSIECDADDKYWFVDDIRAERLEDLYYCALLSLYNLKLCCAPDDTSAIT